MGEEVEDIMSNITTPTTSAPEKEEVSKINDGKAEIHFVLVHGFSHGGWCWYKIRSLMEISGYKVSCVDLKSSGIDPSDPNSILSFDDYNKPLIDFISALPNHEQVILVGHSAGGLSVTQATHKFGKKIRLAVYVASTMLKLGYRTEQDIKDGAPDFSEFEDVFEFGFGLGPDKPPTSAFVKKQFQRKLLYQMSPQEDSTLASMVLRPAPIMAIMSAQFTEDKDNIDEVPRVYIRTVNDHAIKPSQQEAMIKRWPPSDVFTLDSDHSPFFSAPFCLAGLLVKAVGSIGC